MKDEDEEYTLQRELAVFFKANIRVEGDCWYWTGRTYEDNGYGYVFYKDHLYGAADKMSWQLFKGTMPPRGVLIHRSCGNRKCMNPKHLVAPEKKVKKVIYSLSPEDSKLMQESISTKNVLKIADNEY